MNERLVSKGFTVFSFQEQREKNESIKQISGSERKNFLYLEHGITMERNDRIPFEETVVLHGVPRRWGSEKRKIGIGQISTVKR